MIALLLAWLLASPAEAATCSGPACDEIKLETMGACVWVRSRSRDRVDIEARLAKGPVALTLEPADPKKADAGEAGRSATETAGDRGRRCQRALAAEDARNRLRGQGQSIAPQPEIEGVAAECRRAAAAQAKESEQAGVHAYVFDPMFPNSKGTPVYRARLDQGGACVARVEDVQSYAARYPGRAAVDAGPARPALASRCTGDACRDVVFTDDCMARNTGDKLIALKVSASPFNISFSLSPGTATKMNTFHSCVRPDQITAYEASYVK